MKVSTYIVLLFSSLFLLVSPAIAAEFEGVWDTSFGQLKIQKNPGAGTPFLCGYYAGAGFIAGYTRGNEVRGVFVYADQNTGKIDTDRKNNIGTFRWRLKNEANFVGHWRWGQSPATTSDKPWNGKRTSHKRPQFSGQNVLLSCNYFLRSEASKTVQSWMNAVTGTSLVSPVLAGSRYAPEAILMSEVKRRENLSHFKDCMLGTANPNILWCNVPSRSNKRYALDLTLCKAGTIKSSFSCETPISGSFKSSCTAALTLPTPASGEATASVAHNRVSVSCKGPEWSAKEQRKRDDMTVQQTRYTKTEYVHEKHGYHYHNTLKIMGCQSWSYWNQNGVMRCSGS